MAARTIDQKWNEWFWETQYFGRKLISEDKIIYINSFLAVLDF